ncbi:Golgi transport complex subunit 6 [Tulasnella sp. 427]|nr:Golgi transport complex subunit 6 [Tulasnella sp. 427]
MSNKSDSAPSRLQVPSPQAVGSGLKSPGLLSPGGRGPPSALTTPSFFHTPPGNNRLPSSIPSKNPLALRLYKVLGANYSDASTREALETLSSFYAPGATASGSGAVESILGAPVVKEPDRLAGEEEEEEEEPTELWGTEYARKARRKQSEMEQPVDGELALRARKGLRRDIETKLAESSRKFLTAFAEVDKKLDILQVHVAEMQTRCDEAQSKLQATNESCKHLLERAEGLRVQRQATGARQSIITLFLSRFTLTEEETQAVASRDVPVGPQVFAAMDRIEKIRNDCRVLMSGEEGQTKAGLDIMSLTASLLDQAYQKLARWTAFEFRQMGKDASFDVAPVMQEAVLRLRQRPEHLHESLKILTEVRQTTLLASFMEALTRGGPGGLPRPIELHAHDPTRYVGDMLAWVHQTMAGEREYLESLFGIKGDNRMVGSVRQTRGTEEEEYVAKLMDGNLEKLCMPLRVRVLQTVKSQEGSITSYKIANLLQFYLLTVSRTVGEEALLSQTLKDITDAAYQVFFDTIDAQGRSLLRFLHPPDSDLSPPLALRDSSQVLREIMAVYDSSLLGDEDPTEREAAFAQILEAAVDPAMEMCKRMSELKDGMSSWDKAIFLINCTTYMQNMLQTYSFTSAHVTLLQKDVDRHVRTLVTEHSAYFLKESGLEPIVQAMDSKPIDTPLSRLPSASSQALTAALTQFDSFLSTLDPSSSPRLALLSVPRLASSIHTDALHQIGRVYGRICDQVRKPENKYEFAGTLLGSRRPFGDMRVLWQILGVDVEDGQY